MNLRTRQSTPTLRAADEPPRRRYTDPGLPLIGAAFALGIVIAASAILMFQLWGNNSVAQASSDSAAELASTKAALTAQQDQIKVLVDALDDAEALSRALVKALDQPALTTDQRNSLRKEIARQRTEIERVRLKIVRVPVPGPTVTAAPATTSQPGNPPLPSTTAQPTSTPCSVSLLGLCLTG